MKTLMKQSITHSIEENFKLYSEDYPMQSANNGVSPTEESISTLVNWVENTYINTEEEDKGSLDEWFEVAKNAFYDYFELQPSDFEDSNEVWEYLNETVEQYRTDK